MIWNTDRPLCVICDGKSRSAITVAFPECSGRWEGAMKLARRKFLRLAAGAAAVSAISRVISNITPYIRDEEILDSIKTHVLKKMAGIGRFR
jgi:hypothetical protein